jgi:hypothetical protein
MASLADFVRPAAGERDKLVDVLPLLFVVLVQLLQPGKHLQIAAARNLVQLLRLLEAGKNRPCLFPPSVPQKLRGGSGHQLDRLGKVLRIIREFGKPGAVSVRSATITAMVRQRRASVGSSFVTSMLFRRRLPSSTRPSRTATITSLSSVLALDRQERGSRRGVRQASKAAPVSGVCEPPQAGTEAGAAKRATPVTASDEM